MSHWRHQLKVVSVRIGQGRNPPISYFVGFSYDLCAESFHPLKFLVDLRGFKIKHDASGIFGVPPIAECSKTEKNALPACQP